MVKQSADFANASKTTTERPIAMLRIEKVTFDNIPVVRGNGGSFGELIDSTLTQCAMNHEQVRSLQFMVEEQDWYEIAKAIQDREQNRY